MSSVSKQRLFEATGVGATATGDAQSMQTKWKSLVGFIKVSNYTGGTFTGKIEHSPNGVDWFTLKSFTAIGSSTSEIQQITDNCLPQVRGVVTYAAGGTADVVIELYHDDDK